MIDEFLQRLAYVCAHPRYIEILVEEECSLLRAGKISVYDWRKILRNQSVCSYTQFPTGKPPTISRQRIQPSMNHPANMAIRWMSEKILEKGTPEQQRTYKKILTQSGWTTIPKAPMSNSALLFFFNDPHYASLFQCGRAILRKEKD